MRSGPISISSTKLGLPSESKKIFEFGFPLGTEEVPVSFDGGSKVEDPSGGEGHDGRVICRNIFRTVYLQVYVL